MPKVRISAVRFRSLLDNRRMTAAGLAAKVTTDVRLEELAQSDQDVDIADLRALGKVFGRTWSYFLRDEPEVFPQAGDDHRTYSNQRPALSPDLITELQATDLMLAAAAELFPEAPFLPPSLPLGARPSAAKLGAQVRAWLDVSIDDQLKSKDDSAALRLWVAALHAQNIYVSQRHLSDPTIRAFSKLHDGQALVVVDTQDTAYARIFSVLHEYCHIVLRTTGICDLDDHNAMERYCNAVAAEALLPDELLDRKIPDGTFTGTDESQDDALQRLSRQLRVSQATLLIRLRDRGAISQAHYDQLESRRSARRGGKRNGGSYYAPKINRVGRLFAHRVVDAMDDDVLDRQDAAALLGVGEHIVDRYATELAKGDRRAR